MLRILFAVVLFLSGGTLFASDAFSVGNALEQNGFWAAFLLVYVGGFFVSLTPCVYPMIPITLGIIGARNAQQSPLSGFIRSLFFVFGIVVVYALLGLIAVKTGRQVSFAFQNPWVIGAIAVFFAAMGASMLDLFSIQMPAGVAGRLQMFASSHSAGLVGAFLLGGVTAVVASPCGSPVLAGVIAVAAGAQTTMTGVLLLAAYALGLGTLFVFLGTFPALLNKLPKSGMWMVDIKKALGLVLIAVALYLLAGAMPLSVYVPILLIGIGTLVGLCVVFAVKSGANLAGVRLWTVLAVAVAVSGAYGMRLVSGGDVAAVAASGSASASRAVVELTWLSDVDKAKEQAAREGKSVMIDFGAEWCAACKKLEKETFSDSAVREKLAKLVLVKVDCTEETDENSKLQQEYQALSLPTVVFLKSDGTWIKEQSLYQFESAGQFLERLSKMP